MDGGAWWAAVHGVAESRTRLSNFTFTFHFHALVLSAYILIDAGIIATMMIKARHLDFCFSEKE